MLKNLPGHWAYYAHILPNGNQHWRHVYRTVCDTSLAIYHSNTPYIGNIGQAESVT